MSELTSIVKETSDNGTDLSPDDIGTIEEMPEDTILSRQTSVNLVPFIGQRFVSQDAAYEFYCSFAKQCGFSIRRHRTRGKDGVGKGITRRDFTCHLGGYPQLKPSDDGKMQRNRKSSRCGCQAYMRIVKRADFDVPEWRITGFNNAHNHELLKSHDVQLLPAYCTISADDKSRICMFAKAGMSVRQMLRLVELEKGVKLGNVDRDNDAMDLLAMCKDKTDKDPNFKYQFEIDSHNRNDEYISIRINRCLHTTVAAVIDSKDLAGDKQKMRRRVFKVSLKTGSPIESYAASVLTPYAFCKLQEELVMAPQYASLMVNENYFIVRHHTELDGGHKVLWIPHDEFINCSCHQFEFSGILCRHVLRVLSTNNCFHIPDQYLPLRWHDVTSSVSKTFQSPTCGDRAGKVQVLHSMISTLMSESIETEEHFDIACDQIAMVLSRIKELPGPAHGPNDITYNSPSDSLILPEVEDSDGTVPSFTAADYAETKLKELKAIGPSSDCMDIESSLPQPHHPKIVGAVGLILKECTAATLDAIDPLYATQVSFGEADVDVNIF
ncbi:FAR1 DNA binding domain [Dillenia turbinata]|uniref:Protein FAR1-RELATED SEQUENCE n=1 Tax=Dillenia turbinata TaxID=194707 RepID=A0AAN8W6W7_9MAGN